MPKYIVQVKSSFSIKYFVEANSLQEANLLVKEGSVAEFSQYHIDEDVMWTWEVTDAEYLKQFNEDNPHLHMWTDDMKLHFLNRIV